MIPTTLYTPFFFNIILIVVLITCLHTQIFRIGSTADVRFGKIIGNLLFIFTILYMGLRPIDKVFVDMIEYDSIFRRYQWGENIATETDILFYAFTKLCSYVMNAQLYFFICTCIYVIPLYIVSKKWFNKNWFYGFLFFIISMSFWGYGVNGIRNGIAGSIFLYAISKDRLLSRCIWFFIAINIHKSMLLPTVGFLLANTYNKPKSFLYFWILSIPISLIFSNQILSITNNIAFINDRRISDYIATAQSHSIFNKSGFRWDFLLYSGIAVIAGGYYIFKRKFSDNTYTVLFNTYVFSNTIWIFLIKANYSNRFAYLSWFMISIILCYPLLKKPANLIHHKIISIFILLYYLITYLIN